MATNLVIDAKLSKWSYNLNNSGVPINIDGWQTVSVSGFVQTSANFAAQLFVGPGGTYKIAYRGTASLTSSGDAATNTGAIVLNNWTQELTDGIKFTDAAIKYIADIKGISYDKARALLSVTGHSQGGFEAEVNAKFFGIPGTSLDGPGASAITQVQAFANLKTELQASEPQLLSDYPIGDFVARRYTFIVGGLNAHVDGVTPDNSITSLAAAQMATLANPLVGIGVQAQFLHKIDNIIEMESARANSRFWQILGADGTTDTLVNQIGGYMYPTNLANADGSVQLVTPDVTTMNQITSFLASDAGAGATIHVRDGATYIEGNGNSLLIRGDGSGERWVTSNNMVTQEILGKNSIVTDRVETRFADNQVITDTSRYDLVTDSLLIERRIVQTNNNDGSVTREVFKGGYELVVTSTAKQLDNGSIQFTDVYPDGKVVTRVEDALLEAPVQSGSGAQTLAEAITTYAPTVIDALTLIKAIQSGDPLPVTVSGLRLVNDVATLTNNTSYSLSGAANVGSGILSLMSLEAALKRGDSLSAITAGAQTLGFGASAYLAFAQTNTALTSVETATDISNFFNGTSGPTGAPGAIAYLNIVNSLANGDAMGTAMGVLALNPATAPIATAYAVFNMVTSLFSDNTPPEAWGNASATWSGFNAVANATGAYGGLETATQTYNGILSYLGEIVAQQQTANPDAPIGIVANRLPSLSYRNYTGYSITDIDPLTGEQRNPGVLYDLNGRPYNAPAGSVQASQSLNERMIRVALERGAIAPLWEVKTAAYQTQAGDPMAGLTEEERAGRAGLLAPSPQPSPASGGGSQVFRPVALDLNGDGVQTTGGNKTAAFDVDDTGYLKNTAWLSNGDGFLFLDRNLNGQIDGGREVFSNGVVGLSERGLKGMRWIDSNYDGKITALDPVWNELKVWQDADGDSVNDAGETKTLAQLGITSLDYAMGAFSRGNQVSELSSPDLVADTEGTVAYKVSEACPELGRRGIVIQGSGGQYFGAANDSNCFCERRAA